MTTLTLKLIEETPRRKSGPSRAPGSRRDYYQQIIRNAGDSRSGGGSAFSHNSSATTPYRPPRAGVGAVDTPRPPTVPGAIGRPRSTDGASGLHLGWWVLGILLVVAALLYTYEMRDRERALATSSVSDHMSKLDLLHDALANAQASHRARLSTVEASVSALQSTLSSLPTSASLSSGDGEAEDGASLLPVIAGLVSRVESAEQHIESARALLASIESLETRVAAAESLAHTTPLEPVIEALEARLDSAESAVQDALAMREQMDHSKQASEAVVHTLDAINARLDSVASDALKHRDVHGEALAAIQQRLQAAELEIQTHHHAHDFEGAVSAIAQRLDALERLTRTDDAQEGGVSLSELEDRVQEAERRISSNQHGHQQALLALEARVEAAQGEQTQEDVLGALEKRLEAAERLLDDDSRRNEFLSALEKRMDAAEEARAEQANLQTQRWTDVERRLSAAEHADTASPSDAPSSLGDNSEALKRLAAHVEEIEGALKAHQQASHSSDALGRHASDDAVDALEEEVRALKVQVANLAAASHHHQHQHQHGSADADDGVDVLAIVRRELEAFSADHGLPRDWAHIGGGATILPGYTTRPLSTRPEAALDADNSLSKCYCFQGSKGGLTVALPALINVSSFTLDHVSPEIAHNPRSAPRRGVVVGYASRAELGTEDGGRVLGEFHYQTDGARQRQTFSVSPDATGVPSSIVKLHVHENHGAEFTCIYRFRVHGDKVGDAQRQGLSLWSAW